MHEINGNNTKFIRWETTFVVAVGGFQPMKMYMMIIAAITGSDAGLPSERLFITTEAKGRIILINCSLKTTVLAINVGFKTFDTIFSRKIQNLRKWWSCIVVKLFS